MEDIVEEDCYVMLCLKGGERTWQRNPTIGLRETHYTSSGAKAKPFRKDNVPKRHTGQINSQPGSSETNSAEEFPWESTVQGGSNALLLPATRAQQQNMFYDGLASFRRSGINFGEWFRITFTVNLGEICRALHQEPPNDSICKKPTVTVFGKRVNLNDFVWTMAKVGSSLAYYHAAGSSKGKIGKRMDSIEMPFLHSEEGNLNEGRAETWGHGDILPVVKLDGNIEDGKFDALEARADHVEDAKLISPEHFDGDLDDSELTEEDLEIIKP
ncbi:hypothetical protein CNMCM6069_002789 [Aspergillus lentulus]|nr:hypothetical protein CNMCM6069_002789 [Aspergillus lentulus]KAF4177497.1 hypothetical protein CNMCM8060_005525 [Aspergillus lentulus]KAF4179917.1 hypothetical protein CNMCM7927_001533 [Aspergillus lentulus]KAF4192536.1 hypothetical protein CNMCM8694_000216 [Aspergillus lentulus]GFF69898.1 hypothetical protein IFM62136_07699 [Aspergillus lentulus]